MSDAYQDKDLQSVEKDTGQTLSSIAQIGAMLTAFIPKRKAKVIVKKPQQAKPEPHPEMAHKGVKQDLLYIEAQRAKGRTDTQIKQELTQLSQVHRTAQTRFGNGEQYLDTVMKNAQRAPAGKFPSQGLATKQANKQNMKK